MSKNNFKQKKKNAEVKRYKNSLGESACGIDSTYGQNASMLVGSDSFSSQQSNLNYKEQNEPIAKKSWHLVVSDWIKQNGAEMIFAMILIPLLIWIVSSVFEIQSERKVSEYRIGQLEKNVSELESNAPNKETIEMEIKNLKDDFNKLDSEELEKRIEELEGKVFDNK